MTRDIVRRLRSVAVLGACAAYVVWVLGAKANADPPTVKGDTAALATVKVGPIEGRCHDGDGHPLANVRVTLHEVVFRRMQGREVAETTTDADGKFVFADVTADGESLDETMYWLIAQSDGRATALTNYYPADRNHRRIDMQLTTAVKAAGLVSDEHGQPVAGASIEFASGLLQPIVGVKCARTDSDGHFEVRDLDRLNIADRDVHLGDGVRGAPAAAFRVVHPDFAPTRVPYLKLPGTFRITLRPAAKVSGRVLYGRSSAPASGVTVFAQPTRGARYAMEMRAITDGQGHYKMSLSEGTYNIFPFADELTAVALNSIHVVAGETQQPRDLVLVQGAFITGHIVDAKTGGPIRLEETERVRIGVYGPAKPRSGAAIDGARVQADGSYRVRVAPGANYVYLSGKGPFQVVGVGNRENVDSLDVEVADGGTAEVDFRVLRPPAAE